MKLLFTLLLIITTITLADSIREGSMQALSNGSSIFIRWGTTDESEIKEFHIERRSGYSGEFTYLTTVQKKGSNSSYEYEDKSAYKSTASVYQYRITVLYNSGGTDSFGPLTVTHNVSSVKRTWGSLKAMFR